MIPRHHTRIHLQGIVADCKMLGLISFLISSRFSWIALADEPIRSSHLKMFPDYLGERGQSQVYSRTIRGQSTSSSKHLSVFRTIAYQEFQRIYSLWVFRGDNIINSAFAFRSLNLSEQILALSTDALAASMWHVSTIFDNLHTILPSTLQPIVCGLLFLFWRLTAVVASGTLSPQLMNSLLSLTNKNSRTWLQTLIKKSSSLTFSKGFMNICVFPL